MNAPSRSGAAARRELPADFLAQARLRGRLRHQHAGRRGDDQRRDLRDQAVADASGSSRSGPPGRWPCPCIRPMMKPPTRLIGGDDDGRRWRRRARTCWPRPSPRRTPPRASGAAAGGGASVSSMAPAFSSASMAICLPGIASRVKRADTSEMRPAPLVMTTNWMMMRMRKMTRPTTRLPPTTKLPNVVDDARRRWPLQQDEARGGDVERQPEQRHEQQQRREDREVERLRRAERDEQQQDGDGQVEASSRSSSERSAAAPAARPARRAGRATGPARCAATAARRGGTGGSCRPWP